MDTKVIPQPPGSLWRNRDYLLLWLGQTVSSLGTSCTQFAFPLLIVGLTRSIAAPVRHRCAFLSDLARLIALHTLAHARRTEDGASPPARRSARGTHLAVGA